jgi:hypothetical protein
MRSTKASAAVERLNRRSEHTRYSMSCRADGLFALRLTQPTGESAQVGHPLPLDEFVPFVNGLGVQVAKRVSKLEVEFRRRLNKDETT